MAKRPRLADVVADAPPEANGADARSEVVVE